MADPNNPGQLKIDSHFGTKAIHAGQNPDQWTFKDVVPPISLTTTYKQYGPNNHAVCFIFNKNYRQKIRLGGIRIPIPVPKIPQNSPCL